MKTLVAPILLASLFASASAFAVTAADQYGSAAPGAGAYRTIVIDSHTRYVNVKHGETVTIRDGQDSVTWYFDGIGTTFELAKIMPAAPDSAAVMVYVTPEPAG